KQDLMIISWNYSSMSRISKIIRFFCALLAFTFCVYGIVDYPLQRTRDRILKSYKNRKELQTS
ncbi:hypothetical protein, partial [Leptospira ellisii]|uniref:hypothetical protein n=1 Tax=Leptospira ellisii TaxID=2023197 RepID=UPI001A9F97EF